MPQRVLVTGATGFLGRQVKVAFEKADWEVIGIGFSRASSSIVKLDLGDATAVVRVLDETKPQVVVHCAANRSPDKCDADPEGARKINVEATGALARATESRSILLIYISTDYVFAGKEGEAPYETDAETGPTNFYGQTKLDGEKVTLKETEASGLGVILRVPVLYGTAEKNAESAINVLLDSVWKAQQEGANVSMDHWAKRYPTNTEDVGRVCKDVAIKYLESGTDRSFLPKVLQFSSEDQMTKYEVCELLAEILGLPLSGMTPNTAGNDPNASVQRPFDTHLSTKALRDLGIPVWTQEFKGWWQGIGKRPLNMNIVGKHEGIDL